MSARPGVAERAKHLAVALDLLEGRLPESVLAPARAALERAGRRSELSAEHTVVALAGATGTGKSSIFNALAGGEIARTSRQRPTTSHALAVVAERPELLPGSQGLLDWLGVPARHDLALSPQHPDGLILLDLPDHDSVVEEHRLRADHITERADLLVWVTNPQKYADAILHGRYLRPLAGRGGTMLVVLNQIDRLSPPDAAAALADLERLVSADGLRADVLATSAHTGEGIAELQRAVAEAAARRRAATERLSGELRAAARSLLDALPAASRQGSVQAARANLLDALELAAGVPTVLAAVRTSLVRDAVAHTGWPATRWLQRLRSDPLRTLGLRGSAAHSPSGQGEGKSDELRRTSLPGMSPAVAARLASTARGYVAAAAVELPGGWGEGLNAQVVTGAGAIADALDLAVARSVRLRRPWWWVAVGWLQWLLTAAMLLGLVWLAALAVVQYFQLPAFTVPVLTLGQLTWPWPSLLAIGGAVLGITVAAICRPFAAVGARRRVRVVRASLRRSVEQVAQERLIGTVEAELTALAAARDAAQRAAA